MTWNWRSVAAAAALSLLAAGAGTVAVLAQDAPPAGTAAPAVPDHAADVDALGAGDFEARERAYDRLRAAGESAREALERGSRSKDAQIRWTSQRLLRLLDEGAAADERRERALRFDETAEDGSDAEDGATTPRTWAVREPLGGFPDLERRMAEVRERMRDLEARFRAGFEAAGRAGDPGAGGGRRSVTWDDGTERRSLDIAEDGKVRVAIGSRGEDGKLDEKVYEAESMEALERDHPEVHGKVKDLAGRSVVLRWGTGEWPRISTDLLRDDVGRRYGAFRDAFLDGAPGETPRAVLGVTVEAVPDALRAHVDIPADAGLLVDRVLPGTLAERLGLKRHDVVLSVNGLPVSTAGDLRAAVAAVEEGAAVRIVALRAGTRTTLEGTR